MPTIYTQAHLDALKEAIASGVLRITYEGKTTEYRTMQELKLAASMVQQELALASGDTSRPPRKIILRSTRS